MTVFERREPDFGILFSKGRKTEAFPDGSVIFKEGDFATQMYVVRKGQVEIRVNGKTIDVVAPGQIFGEMALIEKSTRSAAAVAVGEVEVVAVDEESFLFLVQQTPYFALNVMRTLAARLREMDRRV